jgi:hypothetical protein
MPNVQVNVKVETKFFEDQFWKYVAAGIRTAKQATIDKLFMVAREASWFTRKAAQKEIEKTLGKVTVTGKNGRYRHRLVKARDHDAPLIALMVQKRMFKDKGHGFTGPTRFADIRAKIQQVIQARIASLAYIKSGWIPAIQALAPLASVKGSMKNARTDADVKQIGPTIKGRAEIKDSATTLMGLIENSAWAKHDKTGALEKYGGQGLQHAFDYEAKDTQAEIEKRMKEGADEFNRAQR